MIKEFEGKKLLVLGGIALICDIVKRAQQMGAYVIVADYLENSPAKKIADKAVLINALDVDAIVEFCKEENVDGVTTGFVDILLEPCYMVCKRLGLPCYLTPKMISMSTNKLDFKNTCKEYDVPVPQTYYVGGKLTEEVYSKIHYPVFVKPLDASGSRGAAVCKNRIELDAQFVKALSFSPSKNVVIEDYLCGREFLLNIFGENGEYRVLSMFDRYVCPDRGSAINYSNLAIAPSRSIDSFMNNVMPKVKTMFQKNGCNSGLFFLQGYSKEGKITFFEMGCRLGGSYYDLENACINLDAIEMVVRYALTGKMVRSIADISTGVAKYKQIAICINYLLKGRVATIHEIRGIEEIVSNPVCVSYEKRYNNGDHIPDDRIVDRPIVCLNIVEDNIEKAKTDVKRFNDVFQVVDKNENSLLMQKFNLAEIFND